MNFTKLFLFFIETYLVYEIFKMKKEIKNLKNKDKEIITIFVNTTYDS